MKARTLFVALVFTVLMGAPHMALAKGAYMTAFNGLYRTTVTPLNNCKTCHTRVPAVNAYGKAFAVKHNAGAAIKAALKQIQSLDSDKDGFTNLVEIKARTFPGNKNSKPRKGPDTLAVTDTVSGPSARLTQHKQFTKDFQVDACTFSSTGSNRYFILEPGYQLVLEGIEGGKTTSLVISVLNETKLVDGVETRVVEERATEDGNLVEIARNYFAICQNTNSVFYFGEDVDNFVNGQLASHNGSWLAGVDNARPGVIMPGTILLGSRYFQEVAPGVALDRAEIMSTSQVVHTQAGEFTSCLKTQETTPLKPKVREIKVYAPGVGLVKDGPLRLVSHGIVVN